jgi:hypothetical protein
VPAPGQLVVVDELRIRLLCPTPRSRIALEDGNFINIMKSPSWRISGKVERAKTLLASMLNGDLAAVNATITGPRLIIGSLSKMRQLAADPAIRSSMTTDAAVDECLIPPPIVVHQAKTSGEVGGCPFRRGSLFILEWEAQAKVRQIVTSSSSVRVGAAVPPKTGCLRYWKACGRVSQLRA